jgi:hypothetical protein
MDPLMIVVILCISLPLAWLASEFQSRRGLRIALGCCALGMCYPVAYTAGKAMGSLERFNSNAWYGSASKGLIDTTLVELEAGNTDKVIRELKTLQSDFLPTKQDRGRYDHLVYEYVIRLGHKPTEQLGHSEPLTAERESKGQPVYLQRRPDQAAP